MAAIREFYTDVQPSVQVVSSPQYYTTQGAPPVVYTTSAAPVATPSVSRQYITTAPVAYASSTPSISRVTYTTNPIPVNTAGALVPYDPSANAVVVSQPSYQPLQVYQPVQTAGPLVATTNTNNFALVAVHENQDWQSPYEVPQVVPISTRQHAVYGLPAKPRSLMETDLGDVLLVSEFENTLRHARLALGPVMEHVNTERSRHGLHPIGIHSVLMQTRNQKLVVDKYRHLVIFCVPGSTVKHVNNPKDGTDMKFAYNQLSNPRKNEVYVFVVGPLTDPRLFKSGTGLRPTHNHQGLCDPILRDSGIFQGDVVGLEKLKRGHVLSFAETLNAAQITHLSALFHELARRAAPLHKPKGEYESC
eukprot:TRINITY_DN58893_c0_g1_i1.p1 TRINITY_DN58893_c0_g1~~TRINITY_DN58893_c0_g1_i1.p1  ORF type:complete len:380 (+),score=41.17 TRINITY_DN58893_c0_g1_i1:57-1142(+)